ncbi:Hsp20/alpha crystallin family protein [Rapidithrix thailandica]|uniref:Hsp20/alpha crystallin family protein n=1 Tax=Rapidithrix thailandica TaxID=413964 RepID=A0AAW9S2W0_9BACT
MGTLMKSGSGFFPDFPSVFEDFFNRGWMGKPTEFTFERNTLPSVNVKETANGFDLEVAAPGMNKNDFKIEFKNDILVISAEKEQKEEEKDKEGNYTRREFSYSSFRRSFTLPEKIVNGDQITADYHEGILSIHIPKVEEAKLKPSKQIRID